ncbi:hypothetical protein, partial [Streptomyces sp. NPDC060035]|uniref:hypothetical protein n=1 Tax=Streptomyces sp. NPDC060035 TaxID=3347044 RepID=UPI0036C6BDBE
MFPYSAALRVGGKRILPEGVEHDAFLEVDLRFDRAGSTQGGARLVVDSPASVFLARCRSAYAAACIVAIRPYALEVISFGESAVADEGAGDACEGEEVLGFALVA